MQFKRIMGLITGFLLVMTGGALADSVAQSDWQAQLNETSADVSLNHALDPDQAIVWYLLHCGFAVKTESKLLIFDYIPTVRGEAADSSTPSLANGRINPAELADLDVYVFVTHPHSDHFSQSIFTWRDSIPNITYFFGWDESDDPADHNLAGPRATFESDDIEVYTINSHHSGVPEVAYLVKTDELTIYHAGDYNSDYDTDLPYLKQYADRIDIAMLNDWCGGPIAAALKVLSPRLVFPQHYGGKEDQARDIPGCVRDLELPIRVESPTHRGQAFWYDGGADSTRP